MSTKQRFENLVIDAAQRVFADGYAFATVERVARYAEVSRPTAKKYLSLLAGEGYLQEVSVSKTSIVFAIKTENMGG